jgi:ankyrin repeat protein
VNTPDSHGMTALNWAAKQGYVGYECEVRVAWLDTAVDCRCPCRVTVGSICDVLINAGASVNAVDEEATAPILDACFRLSAHVFTARFASTTSFRFTVCPSADVRRGHLDVAKLLQLRGADMAAVDGILGHTTLHKAIDGNQLHVLTWLLDDVKTPTLDTTDLRGSSPLTIACSKVRQVWFHLHHLVVDLEVFANAG